MRFISGEPGDRAEVTINTISQLTNLSTLEIIDLGKKTKHKGIINFGDFNCTVMQYVPEKKAERSENRCKEATFKDVVKVENFTVGKRRKYYVDGARMGFKAFARYVNVSESTLYRELENVCSVTINGYKCTIQAIKSEIHTVTGFVEKGKTPKNFVKGYKINGIVMTKEEVQKHLSITASYLKRETANAKIIVIDGQLIEITRTLRTIKPKLYIVAKEGKSQNPMSKERCSELTDLKVATILTLAKNGKYSQTGWSVKHA